MKGMTYLTNSLFDYRSPENNGVRAEFILDAANHKVRIKESTDDEQILLPRNLCRKLIHFQNSPNPFGSYGVAGAYPATVGTGVGVTLNRSQGIFVTKISFAL